jgi:hypothetical protein
MLYDNIYVLGDLFQRFLLEHPDVLRGGAPSSASARDMAPDGTDATLSQQLMAWLETETTMTDPSHQATLLQLAYAYEALVEMRDTSTTSVGL